MVLNTRSTGGLGFTHKKVNLRFRLQLDAVLTLRRSPCEGRQAVNAWTKVNHEARTAESVFLYLATIRPLLLQPTSHSHYRKHANLLRQRHQPYTWRPHTPKGGQSSKSRLDMRSAASLRRRGNRIHIGTFIGASRMLIERRERTRTVRACLRDQRRSVLDGQARHILGDHTSRIRIALASAFHVLRRGTRTRPPHVPLVPRESMASCLANTADRMLGTHVNLSLPTVDRSIRETTTTPRIVPRILLADIPRDESMWTAILTDLTIAII